MAIYRSLPGDQNLAIASTLSALATDAMWSGDFAVSERYQREALTIFRATVSRNHPDHAVALANLGYILTQRGKYAEAEPALNEALEIERSVFGAGQSAFCHARKGLGNACTRREGDLHRAITVITEDAVKIASERLGPTHYMHGYYLDSLAHLKLQANDVKGAEADTCGKPSPFMLQNFPRTTCSWPRHVTCSARS